MSSLDAYVGAAQRYERCGQHSKAAVAFMKAAAQSPTAIDMARNYKSAGINFRMAGMYDAADDEFRMALSRAFDACDEGVDEGHTEISNVQRDWAMSFHARGELDGALALLEISHDGHQSRGEWLEMYATISFMGRIYADLGDFERARSCFDQAHLGLLDSEQPVWSLNNSIHYMKLLAPTQRFFLGLTALELAVKTRYYRRGIEALLLIAPGPKFYDRLKEKLS